jgi:tetratricopeptide (TPR) repeat protein
LVFNLTQTGSQFTEQKLLYPLHAYGRTSVKLKDFVQAKHFFSEALRIAKDYHKKDEDHYEILVMKRSYGHYLSLHEKRHLKEGLQYLKEALEGKVRLYKKSPHQAVIGTIEQIVEVYSVYPNNPELLKLMPTIEQYLDDWAMSEKSDHSKNINHHIMNDRIRSIQDNISQAKTKMNPKIS